VSASSIVRGFVARRAGFSLIEVLIGVLVLSLGLLGLGAIIPVVIREQRQAVTTTLGTAAARAAKEYLLQRPDLDPSTPFLFNQTVHPNVPVATIGWDVWLLDERNWSPTATYNAQMSYLWEPFHVLTSGARPPEFFLDPSDATASGWGRVGGDCGWHVPRAGGNPNLECTISLADRLWPNASVQGESALAPGKDPYRPQFVWDFIGRRLPTRAGDPRQMQVAIFVRQLDLNVRVPRGNHSGGPASGTPITLRDVVLDTLNDSPNSPSAAVPVCSQSASATTSVRYLPTNTGTLPGGGVNYSEVITTVYVDFDKNEPGRLELFTDPDGSAPLPRDDNRWKLVSQSGQKVLDNLGNVYTVRGIPDDLEPQAQEQNAILIDPPVAASVPDPASNGYSRYGVGSLRQIVFTPQIPAAVEVFTITRTVP
jgi:prepilin-type N-terminal cleavage/methylation domain-containing protein